MIATLPASQRFVSTYNNGQPYLPARGRYAPRDRVEDYVALANPVIDLQRQRPTAAQFIEDIVRELKIRFYQRRTIKAYRNALGGFLRFLDGAAHTATRQDVRRYLELLVDAGASASWVGINLSAIRTCFDKMCGCKVTLGLETPRRPKRLPVVLSAQEIVRLLQAAPSLRDKLLLGLMYASGLRVSEVVRLRWRDIDFDRRSIRVWQGKGRTDRDVMLPTSFEPLLKRLSWTCSPEDYLFPGRRTGRHLSPRAAQRVMKRAVAIAGIGKRATCHSLRHSFATHLFEHGTDIRYIQKLLGHMKLETTTIYTKVATMSHRRLQSPLDVLKQPKDVSPPARPHRSVGRMSIEVKPRMAEPGTLPAADVALTIKTGGAPVKLDGIVVKEPRQGWLTLDVPPLESWRESMRWLAPEQRERIVTPEFYRLLQEHVTQRFLAQRRGAA